VTPGAVHLRSTGSRRNSSWRASLPTAVLSPARPTTHG
jgi:hypothetical protein